MDMENSHPPEPKMMVTVVFACPGFPNDSASAHDMKGLYTIGGPDNLKPPASVWCDTHEVSAPFAEVHNLERDITDLNELERLQDETRKAKGFSDN